MRDRSAASCSAAALPSAVAFRSAAVSSSAALAGAAQAQSLDVEASRWGLNSFALVEAAGRTCAEMFVQAFPRFFEGTTSPKIAVLAGSGNNAADALVMLRALVLRGYADPSLACVLVSRFPSTDEQTPLSGALVSVQKLNVPVCNWDADKASLLADADIIIDGIAGTGLKGPLHGIASEMLAAANALRADAQRAAAQYTAAKQPASSAFVVSIDIPSGAFDGWRLGQPLIAADATLAIEPQKLSLYAPLVRPSAGTIVPVGGIFPPALMTHYQEAELVAWDTASGRIPKILPDAHKYKRGLVEIRAGSPGAAGAAKLAALGAQSAGAGLVRLIADPSLYPVLAPGAYGIMVVPDDGANVEAGRFQPAAALLGPGWGRGADRMRLLETYLPLEAQGLPLILDADAIALAHNIVFHGNAILTPHPGECAAYTGLSVDAILADPIPPLKQFASEKNVYILLKGHVLYIASPDGRIAVVDGMNPALAAGGCGDVLAGFCAAIAARQAQSGNGFNGYDCACAAAALLIQAAKLENIAIRFVDPAEVATAAAAIAGRAWLAGNQQ